MVTMYCEGLRGAVRCWAGRWLGVLVCRDEEDGDVALGFYIGSEGG